MSTKKLLESLRALTPELKVNEDERSVKDIIEDPEEDIEDSDDEMEDEFEDDEDDEDSEEDENDDDEEGEDADGDGEADDIHALGMLKRALESSDEETKHSVLSLVRLIVDNDIKVETLEQFLDEVDVDHDEEDEYEDDDEYDEDELMNPEAEEGAEEPDEMSDIEDDEQIGEGWGGSYKSYFMNESAVMDDYDMKDLLE